MSPHYMAYHWGLYEVENGMTDRARLTPYRHDPDPSPIGPAALDESVDRARVRRPAVRKSWLAAQRGAQSEALPRGKDRFVEVSWEEAIDLVARELTRVTEKYGSESVFGGSYGWSSAGRFHHAQSQVHRFLNLTGGYVSHVGSYSMGAARALMQYLVAPMDQLMAEHTDWQTLAEHTELFVTFGGVPAKNAQISAGGTVNHRIPGGLRAMQEAGCRFVNVSPVRDDLETGGAFEWWAIRPNTDTALILGIAHTLLVEGRFDADFVESHCVGFRQFQRYLQGELDGEVKSAAWSESITGIREADVVALARDMASHRTMINMAWSLQRAHHGEQPYWALVALAAMLGQIGLPGGGFGVCYGAENLMGSPHRQVRGPRFSQGINRVSAFIPVARITDMLLEPGATFTYQGGEHRYPDIRLIYWAGGNPFHHHQDLNRLVRAWQKPETIIVNEPFWTPLAKMADIVLPATLPSERNDIFFAKREPAVAYMKQARAVVGEARNDYDIFAAIAERMEIAEAFSEGRDADGWVRHLYEEWQVAMTEDGLDVPDFESFIEQGLVEIPDDGKPVIMLEAFRQDPLTYPLATPSGRIEISSETIAGYGLEDCPGYPCWMPPAEWLGAPEAERWPLHMISDQPARRLHSQFDNSPHSLAGKIQGREPVCMHPDDARARGLSDGDVVKLHNARGSCLAGLVVTDGIRPGVVKLSTGAWFDPTSDDTALERHGNPNVLTLDIPTSSFAQGCSAQTCLVEISAWSEPLPDIRAHDPPDGISNR
ncbi:molybdopterin-dependent oxidoreductase [Salinicola rhizosphaerae]|uniref:Dimethylsulfoxide reductase n=1 Tax=Salinicola rhizosphaerae TaxID=1443141 RepID=A0ABQ3DUV5_9GAMM|nr:molybdopterin-dependent oxidoreductase [Salinicola rhizosphaerae]GHB17170.1 dimethylsulfoxide reductase [Salinicola rhizosphaerae]